MEDVKKKPNSAYKVQDAQIDMNIFQQKYMKKYLFSIGAIGVGLFMGGVVTLGIFAGLFAAVGSGLSMERLKETYPQGYNWIIDNPGKVEIITALGFAGAFGLTATGVVGGLVANILSSVVFDYYAEKEGRVEGVERITFGTLIRKLFSSVANIFKTAKTEILGAVREMRAKKPDIDVVAESGDSVAIAS